MQASPKIYEKGPKNYAISEEGEIPFRLSKKLHLSKNVFSLEDDEEKQCAFTHRVQGRGQIAIPSEMESAFMKYMLAYRIIGYLALLSIFISILNVYNEETPALILMNNLITAAILVSVMARLRMFFQFNKTKRNEQETQWDLSDFMDILIVLPHPTLWTLKQNYYLHLAVMIRVFIILKYLIYSSIFCDVRTYRLITIYGLSSKEHFFFAIKSIVAEMSVVQILTAEFTFVIYFTHCLYLVSLSEDNYMNFMDCFEVVIVSMPTVGFGEYDLPYLGQKIVIVAILVMGAVINSFITLTIISQLSMNEIEENSYWLMQKVETIEHIEKISKNYIQQSFGLIRKKNQNFEKASINFSFRNEYRLKKNLYNSISYTDVDNLFAYFRESLKEFRLRASQTNNMMLILLRHLRRENFKRQFLS